MPLGTLHWIPSRPGKNRKPIKVTRHKLRIVLFLLAILLAGLIAVSFIIGYRISNSDRNAVLSGELTIMQGEYFQLLQRVDDLSRNLVDVAEREEQVLVAGAGLNIDFSHLIPFESGNVQPPGEELFCYIDDIELKLLLAERLVEAELLSYDSLLTLFVDSREELAHIPSIWPADGNFVSDFGARIDPFTGAVRYHKGIDIAASRGTPIYAPADGEVIFAGWTGGWGRNVVIRHTESLSTRYAHCNEICTVVGQDVKRGDLIAKIGSTG